MGTQNKENPGIPRWVKLSALIVAIAALLAVVAMLMMGGGGDGHGPSRHASGGDQALAGLAGAPEGRTGLPTGVRG